MILVFFFWNVFFRFGYQGIADHIEWVRKIFTHFLILWKSLYRIYINFPLYVWQNSPMTYEVIWASGFSVERFFKTNLFNRCRRILVISSWVSIRNFCLQGITQFILSCWIYNHKLSISSDIFLLISSDSVVFPSFSFLMLVISRFCFSPWSVG